jgi:hypothetical protein
VDVLDRRAGGRYGVGPLADRTVDRDLADDIHTAACPEMTALAGLVRSFAALLTPAEGNAAQLTDWIAQARATDLPHLHARTRGFELDRDAVDAALTRAHHNGGTEGGNTKTKLIKRQMYGRAGFPLLRHRILLS